MGPCEATKGLSACFRGLGMGLDDLVAGRVCMHMLLEAVL